MKIPKQCVTVSSKLTINTPEQRRYIVLVSEQRRRIVLVSSFWLWTDFIYCSVVFIVQFEQKCRLGLCFHYGQYYTKITIISFNIYYNLLLIFSMVIIYSFIELCRCNKIYTKYRSSHPEVLLVKGVLKICSTFTGEHPLQSVISIKLQSNFIEITLRHGCSVYLLHIFKTSFLKNNFGRLLLQILHPRLLLDVDSYLLMLSRTLLFLK